MKRSMMTLNPKSADDNMKKFRIKLGGKTTPGAEPPDYNAAQFI